ncbi:MAG TPA: hypothetical protein PLK78_17465 [Verrucomicrobiota bacterium]|nr:hypothetical protein [Verrucomicrobiota bacterium]
MAIEAEMPNVKDLDATPLPFPNWLSAIGYWQLCADVPRENGV